MPMISAGGAGITYMLIYGGLRYSKVVHPNSRIHTLIQLSYACDVLQWIDFHLVAGWPLSSIHSDEWYYRSQMLGWIQYPALPSGTGTVFDPSAHLRPKCKTAVYHNYYFYSHESISSIQYETLKSTLICNIETLRMCFILSVFKAYRIARKFGGELNLVVWQISQPTAKLKTANIKLFLYFAHEGDRTSRCK